MSFTSAENRWRDVYAAAGARAISQAGDFLAATALMLAFQERGAGGYAASGLLLAASVPMIVMAPLGGRLADRFDSRVLLVAVGLAQAACCAAMAFVTAPVALIGLTAVLAAGLAITQPTLSALVPAMVTKDRLPRALALGQTASSIGILVGPAAAGVIYGGLGLRAALLVDAASYLAIAAVGLVLKTRRARSVPTSQTGGVSGIVAWRLRNDRLLTYLTVAVSAVLGAISMTNVVFVFLVRGTFGASPTAYGLFEAIWIFAMLGGSWVLARFAGSDTRLTLLMLAFLGFSSVVLASVGTVPAVGWLVPLYLLGGLANGAENVIGSLLLARRVPNAHRGRAYGIWSGALSAASTAGYLIAGPVLDALGPRAAMVASGGAGLLVVAALTVPLVRAVRTVADGGGAGSGHELLADGAAEAGAVVPAQPAGVPGEDAERPPVADRKAGDAPLLVVP